MANPERGGFVESYKKLNELTLVGALGVAIVGAFFAPSLVAPAIAFAAFDGAQIVAINEYQKRKERKKLQTA